MMKVRELIACGCCRDGCVWLLWAQQGSVCTEERGSNAAAPRNANKDLTNKDTGLTINASVQLLTIQWKARIFRTARNNQNAIL